MSCALHKHQPQPPETSHHHPFLPVTPLTRRADVPVRAGLSVNQHSCAILLTQQAPGAAREGYIAAAAIPWRARGSCRAEDGGDKACF